MPLKERNVPYIWNLLLFKIIFVTLLGMPSNLNIVPQFPCWDAVTSAWVQYSTRDLIRVLCIVKTTFASLEIKFLTIQPITPFAVDTINKLWLSALNVSLKATPRSHSSFIFSIKWVYTFTKYMQLRPCKEKVLFSNIDSFKIILFSLWQLLCIYVHYTPNVTTIVRQVIV